MTKNNLNTYSSIIVIFLFHPLLQNSILSFLFENILFITLIPIAYPHPFLLDVLFCISYSPILSQFIFISQHASRFCNPCRYFLVSHINIIICAVFFLNEPNLSEMASPARQTGPPKRTILLVLI